MQKWEYLFVHFVFEENDWRLFRMSVDEKFDKPAIGMYEIVNALGDKGWEMVTHETISEIAPQSSDGFITRLDDSIRMVFKRPMQPTTDSKQVAYSSQRVY